MPNKQSVDKPVSQEAATRRLFDASTNRALEALRVVEDVVRFIFDDAFLTEQWKQVRHDLAEAVAVVPAAARHAARQTTTDVGTTVTTESERRRADTGELLQANLERLKQSLRSLEEVAKLPTLQATGLSGQLEALRYRVYTLESTTQIGARSRERLAEAKLYWLTAGEDEAIFQGVLAAGVDIVQLRAKGLSDRELLRRARRLCKIARKAGTLFIVNDRPDIALLTQADGVHVGQDELAVADVRRVVGTEMLIGVSTHDIKQARQAVLDGATYLGVGPTFDSTTKTFDAFAGLDYVRQVAPEISLPWFAIGGIGEGNLAEVTTAGAVRIAVGAAITTADDAKRIRAQLPC